MEQTYGQPLAGMLDAAENASPVAAVEAVTRQVGEALGARAVSFLIADLSGRALVRLAHLPSLGGEDGSGDEGGDRRNGDEVVTVLPFDGGDREQTLRTQTVRVVAETDGWTVLAPVTERGEVIGVLEFSLPTEPRPSALTEISRTAHALAFVVIANRRHTDLFEWGQRTTPFTLSAEIQRRLLPAASTCEAGGFTLAGWLEPAASIGGDTFDYSLARDVLHFSVTDAMGHGVNSALTATLGVGSLRNTRRRGYSLVEQAEATNVAVAEHAAGRACYLTAVLGRLDLRTGGCQLLNAGHVPPLLVRDGEPRRLELPTNFPIGMFDEPGYRNGEVPLRPGDRLVIVTDGIQERNAAGLDLTDQLRGINGLHPREAVRALADAVLHVTGRALIDDATLLILDWYGGCEEYRHTRGGADPARASVSLPE